MAVTTRTQAIKKTRLEPQVINNVAEITAVTRSPTPVQEATKAFPMTNEEAAELVIYTSEIMDRASRIMHRLMHIEDQRLMFFVDQLPIETTNNEDNENDNISDTVTF